jgi:D-beta-D-heptose 7-phosphate kinase/D-beta-D-heptose 1-phosphate adenosyltransferase
MKRFLIIGDFILDSYIFGSVEKISPEAPVMEFKLNGKIEHKLGGAANVAWILDNLGVAGVFICKTDIDVCSIAQLRKYGLKFQSIQFHSIIHGKTCQKIRLIDENYHQHILRLAVEDGNLPHSQFVSTFEKQDLSTIEAVVFSDYQKGLLSDENILYVREKCQDIPIIIAVKYNWNGYRRTDGLPDCACAVVNHKEIAASFSVPKEEVLGNSLLYAEKVVKERGIQNCIITLGGKGATYYSVERNAGRRIPTIEREIFDVTGAGDSFFAVVAFLWGECDIEEIVRKANLAAGPNVASLGNTLIEKQLLDYPEHQ